MILREGKTPSAEGEQVLDLHQTHPQALAQGAPTSWCVATAITAATRRWGGAKKLQRRRLRFWLRAGNDVLDALTRRPTRGLQKWESVCFPQFSRLSTEAVAAEKVFGRPHNRRGMLALLAPGSWFSYIHREHAVYGKWEDRAKHKRKNQIALTRGSSEEDFR